MGEYDFLGFGLDGFRGFSGGEIQRVGPFGKVHLLAGRNNSGKSSLLDFCERILPGVEKGIAGGDMGFQPEDVPLGANGRECRSVSLAFRKDAILGRLNGEGANACGDVLDRAFSSEAYSRGSPGVVWLDYSITLDPRSVVSRRRVVRPILTQFVRSADVRMLQDISIALCGRAASDDLGNYANVLGRLVPFDAIPPVGRITAIRHISAGSSAAAADGGPELTGAMLNDRLSALENPELKDRERSMRRWDAFLRFVRDVLDDPRADVDVSSATHSIAISAGGTDYLPLASLGTGIEELVILAAEIACAENTLVCVEEPEIHLHPSLQARLVRYLANDDGNNRFIVTTHSATVLNMQGATATLVSKSRGACTTRAVTCPTEVRATLDEIGARPSDLLQTDYLIWVEGPSDRLYVRSWLDRVDPELKEGVHYSVMVYGGKLLNALSADTVEDRGWRRSEGDLIGLFRIGTHFCVLMDSDKESSGDKANATKRRIAEECEGAGAMAWVTDYRTIENYVPVRALVDAIHAIYPKKGIPKTHPLGDKWVCPLSFAFDGVKYRPDKILVARELEGIEYKLDPKLIKRVEGLADGIRSANGMPPRIVQLQLEMETIE